MSDLLGEGLPHDVLPLRRLEPGRGGDGVLELVRSVAEAGATLWEEIETVALLKEQGRESEELRARIREVQQNREDTKRINTQEICRLRDALVAVGCTCDDIPPEYLSDLSSAGGEEPLAAPSWSPGSLRSSRSCRDARSHHQEEAPMYPVTRRVGAPPWSGSSLGGDRVASATTGDVGCARGGRGPLSDGDQCRLVRASELLGGEAYICCA